MSLQDDRSWMYSGWNVDGRHSEEWIRNTNSFIDRAFQITPHANQLGVRCPCSKCRNAIRRKKHLISNHLCQHGFLPGYTRWVAHGERPLVISERVEEETYISNNPLNDMLGDIEGAAHVDHIEGARSELCTDDAPDISRYIPFLVQDGDGDGEKPLPEAYYGNPEALMRHINRLCMEKFPKFRDFERWVRSEHDRNGFVEVEYDYDEFEKTQHEREQRRGFMAELLAEEMADLLPTFEDGEFGDYVEVYDEEKREFIMREVEGNIGVPVFDKEKKKFVFVKKN